MQNYVVYKADGSVISQFICKDELDKSILDKNFAVIAHDRLELPLHYYEVTGETITLKANVNDLQNQDKWNEILQERAVRLNASDWTQSEDAPLNKDKWITYRQELRDIPSVFDSPEEVSWPTVPQKTVNDEINVERDKRIFAGTGITLDGYIHSIAIKGDKITIQNIQGLLTRAKIKLDLGNNEMTVFRDAHNVDHFLTHEQIIELGIKAIDWVESVFVKAWALKAMNPTPQNMNDDQFWV